MNTGGWLVSKISRGRGSDHFYDIVGKQIISFIAVGWISLLKARLRNSVLTALLLKSFRLWHKSNCVDAVKCVCYMNFKIRAHKKANFKTCHQFDWTAVQIISHKDPALWVITVQIGDHMNLWAFHQLVFKLCAETPRWNPNKILCYTPFLALICN